MYTATFGCGASTGICISREAGIVYWRNRESGVTWEVGYGVGGVSDNGEWAIAATDVPTPEMRGPEIRRVRLMDGRMETVVAYSELTQHPVRRIIADNGLIALTASGISGSGGLGIAAEESRVDFESYVIDPRGQSCWVSVGFRWDSNVGVRTLCRVDLTQGAHDGGQTERGRSTDLAWSGTRWCSYPRGREGKNPQWSSRCGCDLWFRFESS